MNENSNAIILCRVSTTEQAEEGESLEIQERSCRDFCEKNGFKVVDVLKEDGTGKKEDREVFRKIEKKALKFKDETGESIQYLVFSKIDRLTRAGAGEYDNIKKDLRKLGIEPRDVWGAIRKGKQVVQDRHGVIFKDKSWAYDDTVEIGEQFHVAMAKVEGNTIIQRTQDSEVDIALLGYNTNIPPFGYKPGRTRDTKKLPILEEDEFEAPCIKMLFSMRCEGTKTDVEIVQELNKNGYRTRQNDKGTGGKEFEVKNIQRMVMNIKYAGIVQGIWTGGRAIKMKGKSIVTIEEFNTANRGKIKIVYSGKYYKPLEQEVFDILYGKKGGNTNELSEEKITKKHIKNIENLDFPYTKLVYSIYGNKLMSGSKPKGKRRVVPYYHATIPFENPGLFRKGFELPKSKKATKGVYFGVPKKLFEKTIEEFLNNIQPKEPLKEVFIAYLQKLWDSKIEQEEEVEVNGKRMIMKLKNEAQQIINTIDSFVKLPNILQAKEKRLGEIEDTIRQIESEENKENIKENAPSFEDFRRNGIYLLEHLGECFKNAENFIQRKLIFDIIFTRIPYYDEIAVGTPIISPLLAYITENSQNKSESIGSDSLWLAKRDEKPRIWLRERREPITAESDRIPFSPPVPYAITNTFFAEIKIGQKRMISYYTHTFFSPYSSIAQR